jgi:outer membrane protein OmpA-like peptidoglycan-associated protein
VALPGDVLFDTGKADIRSDARPTLDKLAELVATAPGGRITIEGHTDSDGDAAYNKKLSERRAEAVRRYLKDIGHVRGDLMTIDGLGEDRPIAPNTDADGKRNPAGMQKNRRVEVVIGKPAI